MMMAPMFLKGQRWLERAPTTTLASHVQLSAIDHTSHRLINPSAEWLLLAKTRDKTIRHLWRQGNLREPT